MTNSKENNASSTSFESTRYMNNPPLNQYSRVSFEMKGLIKMIVIISSLTSTISFAEGVKLRPSFTSKDKTSHLSIKKALVDDETSPGTNENKLVAEFARNYAAKQWSYAKSVYRSKGKASVIVMVANQKCIVDIDDTNGPKLRVDSLSCVESKLR